MKKYALEKWKFLAALVVVAVMLCAQAGRALALELSVRNDFNRNMFVAIIYFDDQAERRRIRGWWNVEPRSERRLTFNTSRSTVYLHARLSGQPMAWGTGDITRMVIYDQFSYFDGETCPPGRNRQNVRFTTYEARNGVLNFRPVADAAYTPIRSVEEPPTRSPDQIPAQTPARAPTQTPVRPPVQTPPSTADGLRANVIELFNLINAERRRAGLPALRLDETMSRAATRRASEIIRKYSHDRPDGRRFNTVFAEFGLAPRKSAENVAWRSDHHNTSMAAFNRAFMDSPAHRAIILNRDLTTVGLGLVRNGDRLFVAQLFSGDLAVNTNRNSQ